MSISYTALLPSIFNDRWHDGTGQITYSFPTLVPSYYTTEVDTDDDGTVDAIKLYHDDGGDVDIPLGASFGKLTTDLAVSAVAAWNLGIACRNSKNWPRWSPALVTGL